MTDSLDDLIAFVEARISVLTASEVADIRASYDAILARLVSLRDAGKELPGEPVPWTAEPAPRPLTAAQIVPMCNLVWVVAKSDYDALRAHAVADRARVKELEKNLADAHGVAQACESRAESAESRVRALEAELSTRTESLAEVNRLLSIHVKKVDDLECEVKAAVLTRKGLLAVAEAEREAMMAKLREPTEEMKRAGDETGMLMCGDECCHDHSDRAGVIFRAMTAAMGVE